MADFWMAAENRIDLHDQYATTVRSETAHIVLNYPKTALL